MAWMLRSYSVPAGRNDDWATLLEGFGMCPSIDEERVLFAKKDIYLAEWNRSLNDNKLDFVLALPFPTPAIPRNSTGKATFMSAAGSFIYNFVRLLPICIYLTPLLILLLARLFSRLHASDVRRQKRRLPSHRFHVRSGIH